MFKNFLDNIFFLNLNEFENIGVNFYINIFLFALALLICIFAICFEISRGAMFTAVKQLIRHEASSEETAKTLTELGLHNSKLIRYMLSHDTGLSKIITRIGAPALSYDEYIKLDKNGRKEIKKVDFTTAQFYISSENMSLAKKIYSTYNVSIFRIVLFCVFVILIFGLFSVFSYEFLCYINSILA